MTPIIDLHCHYIASDPDAVENFKRLVDSPELDRVAVCALDLKLDPSPDFPYMSKFATTNEQLADLRVQLRDREGILWSLRPTGVFDGNSNLLARSSLLIHPTGQRSIRLLSSAIPEELRGGELHVILRNPGAAGRSLFANACEEVNVSLP